MLITLVCQILNHYDRKVNGITQTVAIYRRSCIFAAMLTKHPPFTFTLKKGELWQPVPGCNKKYWVSNYGRSASRYRGWHLMNPLQRRNKKGEISVVQLEVRRNGKPYMITLSHLVFSLFVQRLNKKDKKVVIRHKDNDRNNCRWDNLELSSYSEMIRDGLNNGTRQNSFRNAAKKVAQYSIDGRRVATFASAVEAQQMTGIRRNYINSAAIRKGTSFGYWWRYDTFAKQLPKKDIFPMRSRRSHAWMQGNR